MKPVKVFALGLVIILHAIQGWALMMDSGELQKSRDIVDDQIQILKNSSEVDLSRENEEKLKGLKPLFKAVFCQDIIRRFFKFSGSGKHLPSDLVNVIQKFLGEHLAFEKCSNIKSVLSGISLPQNVKEEFDELFKKMCFISSKNHNHLAEDYSKNDVLSNRLLDFNRNMHLGDDSCLKQDLTWIRIFEIALTEKHDSLNGESIIIAIARRNDVKSVNVLVSYFKELTEKSKSELNSPIKRIELLQCKGRLARKCKSYEFDSDAGKMLQKLLGSN